MKKLLAALLFAGSLALTACQPTMYSSSGSKSNLSGSGYSVEVYSYTEAKARIQGLNYEAPQFTDALLATKGEGDNKDLLLAFFFASVNDADAFISYNNHDNLAAMNNYGEQNLGSNLKMKVGYHNNVAYVGSETAFNIAF